MSQDYGALHGLVFMYFTMAHQGDGQLDPEELKQARKFANKYAFESETLKAQGLEATEDFVNQLMVDTSEWYDRALLGGQEMVFKQYSVILGQTPEMFDREYLYRFYSELEKIAGADGEISEGERALLDKTAETWDLGDLVEGKKLYEYKYGSSDGTEIAWPHGVYNPLHADVFMLTALGVLGDGQITDEETAVVRKRMTALLERDTISNEDIEDAFNVASMWFNSIWLSGEDGDAIRTFHAIGVEMAEINKYNPNVLNLKMQLFRDCCAADGEISKIEKVILDDLATSWKIDEDWSKRLVRYKNFSDYKEEDVVGVFSFFNPLRDYFTVCFAIGAYSFAEAFEGTGIKNTHICLKDSNSYMFSDHPKALQPIPSGCKGSVCEECDWFACDTCVEKNKVEKCPKDHELENYTTPKKGYGCDSCGRGFRSLLPEETEIFQILEKNGNDFTYVSKTCSAAIKSWKQITMQEGVMGQDMTTPIFLESVENLIAGINIATTFPGKPSDKSVVNKIYKILVECAEHNKGEAGGLYKDVIAKLEMIKEKWGVTEEVGFSGVVEDPEL